MLKKAKARAQAEDAGAIPAKGMRESSRQIWLAGLGAFSRAQAEGTKLFESLVEQGQKLEAKTRQAASQTAAAAADVASQKAKEVQAIAGGTWDKLEQVFEDRVARALAKLGVHTQDDVAHLAQRVEALSNAVNELIRSTGQQASAKRPARKAGAKRAAKQAAPATEKPATAKKAGVKSPGRKAPRRKASKSGG